MIAAWMFYCSLCALGLSAAAALAERTLLRGRGAVRFVWVAAVGLSLLVPIAVFQFAPRSVVVAPAIAVSADVVAPRDADLGVPTAATVVDLAPASTPHPTWRATLIQWDAPLAVAWLALSLAVAINLVAGMVALAWMRRRWQLRTVLGVPVFVSEHTGPAVVGVVSPAIVVPAWVMALESPQLSLLLRHEQEHQQASDGRLLTLAQLALVVMPWNVALWWQILRLRGAVELDCDARVLRNADLRSYGNLLLEVARPRRGPALLAATAFAERATQLERRIRVMARHRSPTSRAARVVATCSGLLAVTLAWVAPHPSVPARTQVAQMPKGGSAAEVLGQPPDQRETLGFSRQRDSVDRTTSKAPADRGPSIVRPRPASRSLAGDRSTRRDSVRLIRTVPVIEARPDSLAQGRGTQGTPSRADTIFNRLFEGIALTPDQAARVREILGRLYQEQLQQDSLARLSLLVKQTKSITSRLQRDSALRSLLTNDADRATFDARVSRRGGQPFGAVLGDSVLRLAGTRVGGGGGQRSGGPGGDSVLRLSGGRVGGGGGGGRVRRDSLAGLTTYRLDTAVFTARGVGRGSRVGGGGRGASVDSVIWFRYDARLVVMMDSLVNGLTFKRLFEGITLTADQESRARTLIAEAQRDMQGGRLPPPPARLRMNPAGMVSMPAASADSLLLLLSNEADRAKLQSRISRIP